jgi:hypothetical protein
LTASILRLPPALTPRGLRREAAAGYIGVGVTLFDQLVSDGRMPQPKLVNSIRVWDRLALDAAFESLPSSAEPETNEWDALTA